MTPSKITKGDFIEIEFTGKVKDGTVFDTNKKEVAEKEKLGNPIKPLIVCIGFGMVVAGFDKALEDKEIGKPYTINLSPQESFGERQSSLVKTMPMKLFHQQNINPQPGMSFMMDNYLVRISAVSGGRVIADFNNPLAGKNVIYDFTIKRKLENNEEKVKALMNFFFNQEFPFSIEKKKDEAGKEQEKVIIELDKSKPEQANLSIMAEMMKERFKEMLKLEVEIKESIKEVSQEEKEKTDDQKLQKQENPIKSPNK